MKKTALLFAALLGLSSAPAISADVEWVDRIVAVVNHDIITERDIRDMSANIKNTLPESQQSNADTLRQIALNELIDRKLVLQAAQNRQLTVSDEEIAAFVAQIARSRGMSVQAVYESLAKDGITQKTLHKTIAENILVDKATKMQMSLSSQVSNEDVQALLQQYPQLTLRKEYLVRQILLKSDDKNQAKVKQQLQKIRKQLEKGESFDRLARRYSQDPVSAKEGGSVGWVMMGVSTPEFDRELASLGIGDVSQPIKSEFGWHIIRLDDVRSHKLSDQESIDNARQMLIEQRQPTVYQEWLKQLRSTAYISLRDKPY